jgi:hypothetical protein
LGSLLLAIGFAIGGFGSFVARQINATRERKTSFFASELLFNERGKT